MGDALRDEADPQARHAQKTVYVGVPLAEPLPGHHDVARFRALGKSGIRFVKTCFFK